MENVVKTKTASEIVGVDPKTIRKWVRQFDIPCQRNEKGHYLFTQETIQALSQIKHDRRESRPHPVSVQSENGTSSGRENFEKKLDQLFSRLDELEQKVSSKADEVVTFQVLQHRREMDDISKKMERFSSRMDEIEQRVNKSLTVKEANGSEQGIKKRSVLSSFFSF